MNLTIKNCRILQDNDFIKTNIFIENNKISKVGEYVKAEKEIDANNKVVIPGVIDAHVHFREPGMEYKEDFLTGSIAAAKGGVTTVLDMPNTKPATTTVELLNKKRKLAEKSIINYGFHFGAALDNIKEIKKTQQLSYVASVKLFMNISTGKLMVSDKDKLKEIFANSKLVAVHAEGDKVKEAYGLVKDSGNRLYYCHISTKDEIDFIRKIKNNNIYVEVTPHHLFLTEKDDKSNFTKMKPSLKTKKDQKALWKAIEEGIVDTIGSDHAPHTIEEKERNLVFGVPGVETLLPLLLDAYNKNKISLKKIIELTSKNPAKVFGIKNKGAIKEGYDADLVVVDLDLEKKVKNEELLTKCRWSPFNGWKLKGWPIVTIVNGNVVFGDGKINEVEGKEVVLDV